MRQNNLSSLAENIHQFELVDNFTGGLIASRWTTAGDLTAAANVVDPGAVLKVTHATTDNQDGIVRSTLAPFSIIQNYGIDLIFRASFGVDAATTNVGNFFLGMVDSSTTLTDFVTDNGAGLNSDFEGFGVYKLDSGAAGTQAYLRCATSVGTTQSLTLTNQYPAVGTAGGAFMTFGMSFKPESHYTGTAIFETTFYYDSAGGANLQQLQDSNGKPIKHRVDFNAAANTNLYVVFYSKQGNTTASAAQLNLVSAVQRLF